MTKFLIISGLLLLALIWGIMTTHDAPPKYVLEPETPHVQEPRPAATSGQPASPPGTPPPSAPAHHAATDVYGSPAPSAPPLPPGPGEATAAPEAITPPPQAGIPPEGTAPSGQYDENGEYIESEGAIDYGEWGEGYEDPVSPAPTPDRSDPDYQRWERAQRSWNRVGE